MDSVNAQPLEQNDATDTPAPIEAYRHIRKQSEQLCKPLESEDYVIQVAEFASPPKWHLAHTSWFFETLLLKPYVKGYREYHPLFKTLFNSYYDTLGSYHPRPERGLLSRPTVKEVYQYRAYIDDQMEILLNNMPPEHQDDIIYRTLLGLNHEQQHQELFLTDLKYNFAYNPLKPAYTDLPQPPETEAALLHWLDFKGGVVSTGHGGHGFCYDNETPVHKSYLNDFRLASRPVSNTEFIEFIQDGAYRQAELWLSDAWKTICAERWQAPLYWRETDGHWFHMTLAGMRPVDPNAPVCHISFYEAAAYAKWAGKRLPTETEWETACADTVIAGNFVDTGYMQPICSPLANGLSQMYGDVWEWTQSAYMPYPGYRQEDGPLGEYNGKFMSGQMVLRGGSCATPKSHIRLTYRNFFYPGERWQFSGFRLAEDIQ